MRPEPSFSESRYGSWEFGDPFVNYWNIICSGNVSLFNKESFFIKKDLLFFISSLTYFAYLNSSVSLSNATFLVFASDFGSLTSESLTFVKFLEDSSLIFKLYFLSSVVAW